MKNPKPIKNRFSTLKLRHEDYLLPQDEVNYLQVSFDRVNVLITRQTIPLFVSHSLLLPKKKTGF